MDEITGVKYTACYSHEHTSHSSW